MREVDVLGVRVEMPLKRPLVLLQERDGARSVPIWVGAAEATAIALAQQGVTPPRPLTHDLMVELIGALGVTLEQVRITELVEGVFHAALALSNGAVVDARASDAIALALRTQSPVVVAEAVLDEVGFVTAPDEDDEVERFREFLDQVSAEDFEGDTGEGEPGHEGDESGRP